MENTSIHPRVVKNRTVYKKVNTCATHKRVGKGILGYNQRRLNARRLAHETTIRSIPLANRNSFRMPGSMKGV